MFVTGFSKIIITHNLPLVNPSSHIPHTFVVFNVFNIAFLYIFHKIIDIFLPSHSPSYFDILPHISPKRKRFLKSKSKNVFFLSPILSRHIQLHPPPPFRAPSICGHISVMMNQPLEPNTGLAKNVKGLLAGVKEKRRKTGTKLVISNYKFSWVQRAKPSGFG